MNINFGSLAHFQGQTQSSGIKAHICFGCTAHHNALPQGDTVQFGHGRNSRDYEEIDRDRQREFERRIKPHVLKGMDVDFNTWKKAGYPRSKQAYLSWVEAGSVPVKPNTRHGRR